MGYIKDLDQYLETMISEEHKKMFKDLIDWTLENYKNLTLEIKWNQPMFIYKQTFIIAYSALKNHISVAPEVDAMNYFRDEIKSLGYEDTNHLFKIKYKDSIHYHLIKRIIDYNMKEKEDYTSFWREP